MDEPLTISKEAPEQKSMDYALLREEGLKYIRNIAGKIWTDYNTHDPGITILEVLCYALTDLGYRTSYDIKDIIALDPEDSNGREIYNFFTAAQILPNAPVTLSDYRKLMIDVEVFDPDDEGCTYTGVKNAWIEKTPSPEVDIFVDKEESALVYEPVLPSDAPLNLKILYNILLEFDACDTYGDLNENKIVRDYTIPASGEEEDYDDELEGVVIRVDVEFPRWDDDMVEWSDDASLARGIRGIELSFLNLPGNFEIEYELTPTNEVTLSGTKTSPSGPDPIDGLEQITLKLNQFVFDPMDGIIDFYRQKIAKIREIVDEVKATLHANRNLCEDFLQFNALRIEEILVCADIELELDADVEETQARMYHEIAKFLSPAVYFYSLEEMMSRCFDQYAYDVVGINTDERVFTIDTMLETLPEQGTVISVTGSNNNTGTYTVQQAGANRNNETHTDIYVQETIPSDLLTEGETLYLADLEEDQCMPTEEIFEGPLLDHGFIDSEELALADRKKVIHVSDLIQIIMDVPSVVAVKNIQIANVPQDNEEGAIKSKSVRWCLELAFDQNYVPRLNTDDSRITFFKDDLPFRADQLEVDAMIEELEEEERPQKLHNPVMDIAPPAGEYRDLETYSSIQNEFPLVYGIGEEGVPPNPWESLNLPTEAHARQLKGFLMHFDQLLANYLSQLAHVKDLFSMNPRKDEFGDFVIGRTYYTQPLFDIVPNVDALYNDKAGHTADLSKIAETEEQFGERRNRFLDHLMARFAEQFTDYALLTYRIAGPKSQNELIEDKLAFLNSYPELSSRRGTALNYQDACELWHKDNVSGLEQRASLLMGIEERKVDQLTFSPRFKITGTEPNIAFVVENDLPEDVLKSPGSFESIDEAKKALEAVIGNGVHKHKFRIQTDDDTSYYFQLLCDEEVIAESVKTDFTTAEAGGDADQAIDEVIGLLSDEFYNNPEANRHNLACPLLNYFDYNIAVNMEPNPPEFTIDYQLYETPFDFSGDPILTGSYTGQGEAKDDSRVVNIDTGSSTFTVEGNITEFLAENDLVVIEGSDASDGSYTVSSFALNGDDTDIVVDETIPSDADPLGDLLYNLTTEEKMQKRGESAVHDVLWRLVASGIRRSSYSFDPANPPYTSPYIFQIRDLRGNLLGESEASDFNKALANEIANVSSGTISVIEPGDDPEEFEYTLTSAAADGPNIEIEIDSTPTPQPSLDWQLQISDVFPLKGIDKEAQIFMVEAELLNRLTEGNSIFISGTESNDGAYSIMSITFDGTDSFIKVEEPIPSDEVEGELSYTKFFPVVKTAGSVITIKGGEDAAAVQEMITFLESTFFDHEGMHLIEHILLRPKTNEPLFVNANEETLREQLVQDRLLSINLEEECECTLEDPYTCMAHVVLPYWPGRFTNNDFRRFFEKTLRREAPAHVFLNICWVSCRHMAEFERAYKAWLIENARPEIDKITLSKTLQELIDSIEQLRNVYPEGTLHDCDEDENLENSIILNNSVLGEI